MRTQGYAASKPCPGAQGTSNAHVAALWGFDVMMTAAAMGVQGVYFHNVDHGSGVAPDPAHYDAVVGRHDPDRVEARPLYYAQMMFHYAQGERFLTHATWTSSQPGTDVKVWVTRDATTATGRRYRVFILGKSTTATGTVVIHPTRATGTAVTFAVTNPGGIGATSGERIGGVALDASTGRFPARVQTAVPPNDAGDCVVTVAPASIRVVDIAY